MLSQPFQDAIRQRLSIPLHEGPDRTTSLEAAIRQHVPAGATVYLGAAHGRPNPAVRELVRQWWGKTPGFTLATVGLGSPWTALVHGGLVRRVITTFMNLARSTSPNFGSGRISRLGTSRRRGIFSPLCFSWRLL